jgi:predicted RNase H-like HicB family nuclease
LNDIWRKSADDLEGGYIRQQTFTALVKQDGGTWLGWIQEVPGVNCQEATREALLETLRVTLAEALEFNRQEALGAAGNDYEALPIAV